MLLVLTTLWAGERLKAFVVVLYHTVRENETFPPEKLGSDIGCNFTAHFQEAGNDKDDLKKKGGEKNRAPNLFGLAR